MSRWPDPLDGEDIVAGFALVAAGVVVAIAVTVAFVAWWLLG